MSLYDYKVSLELSTKDYPFYALIMAAMMKADSDNTSRLQQLWPEVWYELQARYNAPGGRIDEERTVVASSTLKAGDACPDCNMGELDLRRYRFSTERGPNLPDCAWLECSNCDFQTDPE